jgi:hypothetical protein
MESEAGYLLVTLEEGVPTIPLFGSRFWRKNSKTAEKFKKMGVEIQKSQKNFRHYMAKTLFSARLTLSSACRVSARRRGGVENSQLFPWPGSEEGVETARQQPVIPMRAT